MAALIRATAARGPAKSFAARTILDGIREAQRAKPQPFVLQQLALATYKSKQPNAAMPPCCTSKVSAHCENLRGRSIQRRLVLVALSTSAWPSCRNAPHRDQERQLAAQGGAGRPLEISGRPNVLDAGGRVVQETRHFHEDCGNTTPGRSKEKATDYRYFPEPDLVPLAPDAEWVEKLRAALPELPAARRARLQEEWGISPTEMPGSSTPARSAW